MAQESINLNPKPSNADHVRGSLEAPVVITEFGDFECPYCGDAYHVLEKIRKKYGDRLALVFRHFPLPMHPHALGAAEAAEAAGAAGKFWEMHDQLYRYQKALTRNDLRGYAEAIGVDAERVDNAIEHRTYRARIERDARSGGESGIEGTPALFINGLVFNGELSVEEVSDTIDRVLTARS